MTRRARLLGVLAILLGGVVGVLAGTQTWVSVVLADGASEPLAVDGASAIPVLVPLSLAVLALGAALSIVGVVLRYVFAALAIVIAVVLGALSAQIVFAVPVSALAPAVTAATGIAGIESVAGLVVSTGITAWPALTLAAQVVLAAGGLFTVVTARRWRGAAGRKYRTAAGPAGSRPHDAVDSWDDLSRGDDPTA